MKITLNECMYVIILDKYALITPLFEFSYINSPLRTQFDYTIFERILLLVLWYTALFGGQIGKDDFKSKLEYKYTNSYDVCCRCKLANVVIDMISPKTP